MGSSPRPGRSPALAHPDTTAPTAFKATGPAYVFKSRGAAPVTFTWRPSADSELEGYSLTVDGRTTILPPGATTFRAALRPGSHRWHLSAYDLSGNRTAASGPSRG